MLRLKTCSYSNGDGRVLRSPHRLVRDRRRGEGGWSLSDCLPTFICSSTKITYVFEELLRHTRPREDVKESKGFTTSVRAQGALREGKKEPLNHPLLPPLLTPLPPTNHPTRTSLRSKNPTPSAPARTPAGSQHTNPDWESDEQSKRDPPPRPSSLPSPASSPDGPR